jgi:hypothetical protein
MLGYYLNVAAIGFSKTENHLKDLCYRNFAEVILKHRRSPRWLNNEIKIIWKKILMRE